jgi:hypothetical protein
LIDEDEGDEDKSDGLFRDEPELELELASAIDDDIINNQYGEIMLLC